MAASLGKFTEDKKKYFKEPPRKMEPEGVINLACHDAACEQTFTCVLLRDFHYNRMHHSRHPSMLSQLTETEKEKEQRRDGYRCIKSDCDCRFLSVELRDFHCSRVHPKLWKVTQDLNDIITGGEDKNEGNLILEADMVMATNLDIITPFAEIFEMTFISDPKSDATSVHESNHDDGDRLFDNLSWPVVKVLDLEIVVAEQVDALLIEDCEPMV